MATSTYYNSNNNNGGIKTYNNRRNNAKNYVKEYTDFSEGYNDMISLIPEVKLYGGTESDYNLVIQNLAKSIGDNVPSYNNPNFPNTLSFSVSSREVGFLTDERLAFGWRIYYNREINARVYQMRITFLTLSMSKRKYIDILESNGWEENEDLSRSSSFLRSISNNSHTYNNYNRNRNYRQNQEESKPVENNSISDALSEDEIDALNNFAEIDSNVPNNVPAEPSFEDLYNIKKTPENNVYIIKYQNEEFTINFTDESTYPQDFYTDFGEHIVGYKDIKYDYITGEVFKVDSEEDQNHQNTVFNEVPNTMVAAANTYVSQEDLMDHNN